MRTGIEHGRRVHAGTGLLLEVGERLLELVVVVLGPLLLVHQPQLQRVVALGELSVHARAHVREVLVVERHGRARLRHRLLRHQRALLRRLHALRQVLDLAVLLRLGLRERALEVRDLVTEALLHDAHHVSARVSITVSTLEIEDSRERRKP